MNFRYCNMLNTQQQTEPRTTTEQPARVFQINASSGGVPKLALSSALVNDLGILSDSHHDTKHHGGPDRAICLYSLEHIIALQQEGHPIFPGSVGENITTFGLELSSLE